jgi:MoaA/NifB/PqqE/SkfB family radical SAM enzyme
MLNLKNIKNIHLELSSNCNASCPLCQRNFYGYKHNKGYEITELRLDDIKKIFSPKFILQLSSIDFNGNFGDFLLAQDCLEIIEYFRTYNRNIYLNIHTNGGARTEEFWTKLAAHKPRIYFDLDGLADTHSLYRIGTKFETVIKNAQAYIAAGGYAIWKMIPFDHNRHQIDQCRELSEQLGFKEFIIFDQGRNAGPVYDKKGNYLYNIDKEADLKFDRVEKHMEWYNSHFKDNGYFMEPSSNISCMAVEKQSIYLAANGEVSPCCFLGFSPRTFKGIVGNPQIKQMLETNNIKNNALENSLEECISWFALIEKTWSIPKFEDGNMFICTKMCGKCQQ